MVKLFNESKLLCVLGVFFLEPDKSFTIREIARKTNISIAWVSKIISKIKKEGLVIFDESKRVRANLESKEFFIMKRLFNLNAIYESGLVDFLIEKYHEPECIMLFGSYAFGGDISRSDVDIAVITNKKLDLDFQKFGRLLKRKVNVHEINIYKCDEGFKNTLANGIVLHGYLKVL